MIYAIINDNSSMRQDVVADNDCIQNTRELNDDYFECCFVRCEAKYCIYILALFI